MAPVRVSTWTILLVLWPLSVSAVLTITRHDGEFINYLDEQAFGNTAMYSCSNKDAQWYYHNGILVAAGPSGDLDLYQFVNGSAVTLVFTNFSASMQGYYTCSIANPAMSASLGVFVTSNLDPVDLEVTANTNDGSITFTWQSETGPEPITNYIVRMGEAQFVVSSNRPVAKSSYRDLLQDQYIRRVIFTVTSVIAGTHWTSSTSAVIISDPSNVSAQAVSASTIRVDWDPLTDNSLLADITGYLVEFRRTFDTTLLVYGLMDQPPAMITGLLPDTMYSFRVQPVAHSNTSSSIVGPFPSSLISTTTQSIAESQTSFPGQQENGGDHGVLIGAIVAASFIFCIAMAIGAVSLLLLARRYKRVRQARAALSMGGGETSQSPTQEPTQRQTSGAIMSDEVIMTNNPAYRTFVNREDTADPNLYDGYERCPEDGEETGSGSDGEYTYI